MDDKKGEGGFNNRVDKVFGCITTSSSTTKQWSLTDAQKHNNNTNKRDDDDETPSCFCNNNINKGDVSIGLDPTLDFEQEEDAYDKMAQGSQENDDDRLYMKAVTRHGPFLNSNNVLPASVHHVNKDPCANHHAAITMLQEDHHTLEPPTIHHANRIKSILKRKSHHLLAKPAKRVSFHATCNSNDYLQNFDVPENGPGVPDYVINPLNYTRYTFDDGHHHVNNKSNTQAHMDLLDQIRKSKQVGFEQQKPPPRDLTSVVFIPRKKKGDAATCNSEGKLKQSSTSIGIAAIEVQQGEVSEMLEDDSTVDALSSIPRLQKPGRRYRSKMEEDDNGC